MHGDRALSIFATNSWLSEQDTVLINFYLFQPNVLRRDTRLVYDKIKKFSRGYVQIRLRSHDAGTF